MAWTIAVVGKGGTGKTTLAALLTWRLVARGCVPVLAVDADPNTCLDQALGVRAVKTVGALREETDQARAAGMDKQRWLELRVAECLVEGPDFDLVAMGRPEGPGCYCYANAVLKDVLRRVADAYPYLVVDNEAGLENLSRRLLMSTDALVYVGDPSRRGLETLRRVHGLACDMGIRAGRRVMVVNRTRHPEPPAAVEAVRRDIAADLLLCLPDDPELAALDEAGESLTLLPDANPLVRAVDRLLEQLELPGTSPGGEPAA